MTKIIKTVAQLKEEIPFIKGTKSVFASAKQLYESETAIIVSDVLDEDGSSEIIVYENGMVLYRKGKRKIMFPLHKVDDFYIKFSQETKELAEYERQHPNNWNYHLMLVGEDLFQQHKDDYERQNNIEMSSLNTGDAESGINVEFEDLINSDPLEKLISEKNDLLDMLNDNQRKIIEMSFIEGLTTREIGKIMNISFQSVSRTIARAIKNIEKNIKK